MTSVCCTRRPSPTTKNHKHTYDSIQRLLCARQSFVRTQTRQQHHHHYRNHHKHTTPAAQQQHSSRDCSRGGGDLTSPATMYVPEKKNKGKRQNKTYQFKINHFPKIRSHNNGRLLFMMQLFWSLKTTKIIARTNRSKCFHINSRSQSKKRTRTPYPTRYCYRRLNPSKKVVLFPETWVAGYAQF